MPRFLFVPRNKRLFYRTPSKFVKLNSDERGFIVQGKSPRGGIKAANNEVAIKARINLETGQKD